MRCFRCFQIYWYVMAGLMSAEEAKIRWGKHEHKI